MSWFRSVHHSETCLITRSNRSIPTMSMMMKFYVGALLAVLALMVCAAVDGNTFIGDAEVAKEKPVLQVPEDDDDADDAAADDDDEDGEDRKRAVKYSVIDYGTDTGVSSSVPTGDFKRDGGTGKAGGCASKYRALENSTMCAYRDSSSVTQWGLRSDEIRDIVNLHNNYRSQEPAKDMLKLYWQPKIAVIAQKLAQSCDYNHDSSDNRIVPVYNLHTGQNLCKGSSSYDVCINMWYEEKADFQYGGNNNLSKTGHFTQMTVSRAHLIGCGRAYCNIGTGYYYLVCNYGYEQNVYDVKEPYDKGTKCASCPRSCSNNLCDCGKKVCVNGGTLIPGTCKCDCPEPYYGRACQLVKCKDASYCGTGAFVNANCKMYSNLPGMCPTECGLC